MEDGIFKQRKIRRWIVLGIFTGMTGFGSGLSGCAVTDSSKVASSEIYTQYDVKFSELDRNLEFRSTFYVGNATGTYVRLTDGSEVSLNGHSMREEKGIFNDVTYVYEILSPRDSDVFSIYRVQYRDNDGNFYENSLSVPGKVNFKFAGGWTHFPLNGSVTLDWSSQDGLKPHENLTVTIRKTSGDSKSITTSSTPNGGAQRGQLRFLAEDVTTLGPGTAEVQLCRRRGSRPLHAPAAGGSIGETWCSAVIPVQFD